MKTLLRYLGRSIYLATAGLTMLVVWPACLSILIVGVLGSVVFLCATGLAMVAWDLWKKFIDHP